jgi:hypothetical protein
MCLCRMLDAIIHPKSSNSCWPAPRLPPLVPDMEWWVMQLLCRSIHKFIQINFWIIYSKRSSS